MFRRYVLSLMGFCTPLVAGPRPVHQPETVASLPSPLLVTELGEKQQHRYCNITKHFLLEWLLLAYPFQNVMTNPPATIKLPPTQIGAVGDW